MSILPRERRKQPAPAITTSTARSSRHPRTSSPDYEIQVLLSRSTGKAYCISEHDEEDDLPEDLEDDDLVGIPHQHDLDLGQPLVREFVSRELPDEAERVRSIFRRRGAYRPYKELLNRMGLLEKWYDFEEARTKEALLEWCEVNGITLEEDEDEG